MARSKTKAELQAENRYLRRSTAALAITSVLNNIIRYGTFAALGWFAYKSIDALAGKETAANVVIKFLGSLTLSQGAAYVFGAGGIAYGWRQNTLRQNTVERLGKRTKKYEERLDPGRTSSKLTEKGRTNPQDKEQ